MKKAIEAASRETMLSRFPLEYSSAPGWLFRSEEFCPGGYKAEGQDVFGRSVSHTGTDPDELLQRCCNDAIKLSSSN